MLVLSRLKRAKKTIIVISECSRLFKSSIRQADCALLINSKPLIRLNSGKIYISF